MKKILIGSLIAMILVAPGCDKSNMESDGDKMVTRVLNVSSQTRTSLQESEAGMEVVWEEGDAVCCLAAYTDQRLSATRYGFYYDFKAQEIDGSNATFEVSCPSAYDPEWLIYPSSKGVTMFSPGIFDIPMPLDSVRARVNNVPAGSNISVGKIEYDSEGLNGTVQMKNAMALLRFDIDYPDEEEYNDGVRSITFTSNAGEAISGTYRFDAVNNMSLATDGTDKVRIFPPEGEVHFPEGTYYFNLPAISLSEGLTAKVSYNHWDFEKVSTNEQVLDRNSRHNMGNAVEWSGKQYFTIPDIFKLEPDDDRSEEFIDGAMQLMRFDVDYPEDMVEGISKIVISSNRGEIISGDYSYVAGDSAPTVIKGAEELTLYPMDGEDYFVEGIYYFQLPKIDLGPTLMVRTSIGKNLDMEVAITLPEYGGYLRKTSEWMAHSGQYFTLPDSYKLEPGYDYSDRYLSEMMALVKFEVDYPEEMNYNEGITNIVMTAAGGEYIAGAFEYTKNSLTPELICTGGKSTINITHTDWESFMAEGTYHILLPVTTLSQGLKVTVEMGEYSAVEKTLEPVMSGKVDLGKTSDWMASGRRIFALADSYNLVAGDKHNDIFNENTMALMKFQVNYPNGKDADGITKIVVSAAGGESVAGRFSYDAENDQMSTIDGKAELTLLPAEDEACFSESAYYFPLPAIDLSQGLKVMLSVGENLTIEYIADDAVLSGEVDLGLTSDWVANGKQYFTINDSYTLSPDDTHSGIFLETSMALMKFVVDYPDGAALQTDGITKIALATVGGEPISGVFSYDMASGSVICTEGSPEMTLYPGGGLPHFTEGTYYFPLPATTLSQGLTAKVTRADNCRATHTMSISALKTDSDMGKTSDWTLVFETLKQRTIEATFGMNDWPVIESYPAYSKVCNTGKVVGPYTLSAYTDAKLFFYVQTYVNDKSWRRTDGGGLLFGGTKNDYMLLPALEGYRLVSVRILGGSTASKYTITNDPASATPAAVSGGETFDVAKNTDSTCRLSDTKANTAYRLGLRNGYASIRELTLTYEEE